MKNWTSWRRLSVLPLFLSFALFFVACDDSNREKPSCCKYEGSGYLHPAGALMLTEGQFGKSPGSLVYISPSQTVEKGVFATANPGKDFGESAQDLAQLGDYYYVISQGNGWGPTNIPGKLTVFSRKDFSLIAQYNQELIDLKSPTHVEPLSEKDVYLRDNKGVWRFDTESKKATFVEGSDGAKRTAMIASQGKLFFIINDKLNVVDPAADKVATSIEVEAGKKLNGLAHADAEHLYLATPGAIHKLNTKSLQLVKRNALNVESAPFAGEWGSAYSSISAKGDTIYFSATNEGNLVSVYRHIYSQSVTKEMANLSEIMPDHKIMYPVPPSVNPFTGIVFMHTIEDYGSFDLTSTIYRFDMYGDSGKLLNTIEKVGVFPAGFYFPRAY